MIWLATTLVLGAAAATATPEAGVAEAWVVEGRVSDNPHQHPIDGARAKEALYIDTVSDSQLVAYVKGEKPPRGAWVRFTGTVMEFEVSSKRPGSKQKFTVRQLSVDETERLTGCDAVQAQVDALASDASMDDKEDAQRKIQAAGIDAFPVLIAALDDPRIYEKNRDVQNYTSMAPNAKRPSPKLVNIPVSSVADEILHRMLIPPGYKSPHERVFKPRGSMFRVESWPAWWRTHRGESLAEIHEEMKPLVDEYFRSGGDTQQVP